ncbi:hypothetical protein JMJ56_30320 [Belnapia sp. T18]|uniref:Nuclease n=1 Tax=Belnapia arida TaxID=2804533 RepID=A0ABS1UCN2_9PROT|nr:hypothetical protein [Belnapia arida]MBL6082275.1 hypothetical protein [Belnapia arida]
MPFVVIRGHFHAQGYSPDGDSLRFAPEQPDLLQRLGGFRIRVNARGHVQLRMEGIDTLETHYAGPGGVRHQPRTWADAARMKLLDFAGITDVEWDVAGNTVLAAQDGTPGYILSRTIEKNGRPVAFVYAGTSPEADGVEVFLDPDRLQQSYNQLALRTGLAYPTFYTGLFRDLRDVMAEASTDARAAGIGLWPLDATSSGFDATSLAVITNQVCLLPKLFRRLSDYMVSTGSAVGFKPRLSQAPEPVLDLVEQNFTHWDTFVEQAEGGTQIRLTRLPEQLVFDEMQNQPANRFTAVMEGEAVTS